MKTPILLTAAAITAAAAAARASVRRTPDEITGEVAIITGASRGLGLAIARELARHSARLVICARGQDQLEAAEADLLALGAEVTAVRCDLADEGSAELLVGTALERYGRLDILVNNAGHHPGRARWRAPRPATTRRPCAPWPWRRCGSRWPRCR